MAPEICRLIVATEADIAFHVERRDRAGMSQHDREAAGIEALAGRIRLKALRECLAIVEAWDGT